MVYKTRAGTILLVGNVSIMLGEKGINLSRSGRVGFIPFYKTDHLSVFIYLTSLQMRISCNSYKHI